MSCGTYKGDTRINCEGCYYLKYKILESCLDCLQKYWEERKGKGRKLN